MTVSSVDETAVDWICVFFFLLSFYSVLLNSLILCTISVYLLLVNTNMYIWKTFVYFAVAVAFFLSLIRFDCNNRMIFFSHNKVAFFLFNALNPLHSQLHTENTHALLFFPISDFVDVFTSLTHSLIFTLFIYFWYCCC